MLGLNAFGVARLVKLLKSFVLPAFYHVLSVSHRDTLCNSPLRFFWVNTRCRDHGDLLAWAYGQNQIELPLSAMQCQF